MQYPLFQQLEVNVAAVPAQVFDVLDDPARVGAHMKRRSVMTLGGRFQYEIDDDGRRVGSTIRLTGRVLGVRLAVVERVTEHERPHRKSWETVGEPRLGIIGRYCMGFEIEPVGDASRLRVFVRYALPAHPIWALLRRLAARRYARWCVERVADDAIRGAAPASR